jgi:hypothetical protein
VISPCFDSQENGVFKTLAHFYPPLLIGQKSDGVNPFKGEVTLVREDSRVMESMGALKPADKTETIPHPKRAAFPFHKKEEMAFHGNVAVSRDDLMGFDQEAGSGWSPFRRTVDGPFHQDALRADESGDMGGRKGRLEIALYQEYSEKKEEGESSPGSPKDSFQSRQEGPKRQKDEEKDLPPGEKEKV